MQPKSLDKFARGKVLIDERTNMCVIYTRVSTKEQADNNFSLETQRKACDQFAIKNNLVVKGYFDNEKKEYNPFNLNYCGLENATILNQSDFFIAIGNNIIRRKIFEKLAAKKAEKLTHRCRRLHETSIIDRKKYTTLFIRNVVDHGEQVFILVVELLHHIFSPRLLHACLAVF